MAAHVVVTIQITKTMQIRRAPIALLALAAVFPATAAYAASGFIVNSDDPSVRDFDALHRFELINGQAAKVGEVRATGSSAPYADVEGLAIDANGNLYGMDDASKTLLRIDRTTGVALPVDGREGNTGLSRTSNFDFGLTFDCVGNLYASSDSRRSLYRLDVNTGAATLVGGEGALGAAITGLAARYDGVYGIGSSGDENLYRIDVDTGRATLIGPLGGGLRFTDGGLDFDAGGVLWGVADMTGTSITPEPSVVFTIDPVTGAAQRITSTLPGVESLAISKPVCEAPAGPTTAPAIPTLGKQGLALLSLLLALLGLVAIRLQSR